MLLYHHFGHGSPESPQHIMLFGGNDGPCLCGRLDDDVMVDGLYGMDIDYAGADALDLKDLGSLKGMVNHVSGGDDAEVFPFSQDDAFPELPVVIISIDNGGIEAPHPDIDRPLVIDVVTGASNLGTLSCIGRCHDDHIGHGTEYTDIFGGMVGAASGTHVDSGTRSRNDDALTGIGQVVSHLLAGTHDDKRRIAVGIGPLAAGGKPGADAD